MHVAIVSECLRCREHAVDFLIMGVPLVLRMVHAMSGDATLLDRDLAYSSLHLNMKRLLIARSLRRDAARAKGMLTTEELSMKVYACQSAFLVGLARTDSRAPFAHQLSYEAASCLFLSSLHDVAAKPGALNVTTA